MFFGNERINNMIKQKSGLESNINTWIPKQKKAPSWTPGPDS